MGPALLERRFFQAFFSTLASRGVRKIRHWGEGSGECRIRFYRAYQVLVGAENTHEDIGHLVRRLRPDPISGTVESFETNLLKLNLVLDLYCVTILARPDPFRDIPHLQQVIERMADAYLASLEAPLYSYSV